jgi:4-carboxymuconolactone decarboxylase
MRAEVRVSTDRMPPIPPDAMTDAQREAAREIAAGRRGGGIGPFVPALRSPEMMRRLQRLGEYLRYDSALEPRLRELTILVTARQWSQGFEWQVHAPLARQAGLASSVVDAVATGRRPETMQADEALVFDFCTELQRGGTVSDATYAGAVTAWGEQGVVDLVASIGYYTTLAMLMNVARTPIDGDSDLPSLPR